MALKHNMKSIIGRGVSPSLDSPPPLSPHKDISHHFYYKSFYISFTVNPSPLVALWYWMGPEAPTPDIIPKDNGESQGLEPFLSLLTQC